MPIRASNISDHTKTMSTDNCTNLSRSPWGQVTTQNPCSLSDVMSEELAAELQKEEEGVIKIDPEVDLTQFMTSDDLDTSNDLLMAQMLQHEFDKDHDREIQIKEDKYNSQSKLRISYQNYKAVHPSLWDEDHEGEEVEELPEREEEKRKFRGRGISGKGKNIVTKHDPKMWGQRHTDRMMDQFPPEMNTGDAIGMDMKLSNQVYNKLRTHTKSEAKRTHRVHEKKEHSTAEHAMDPKTRLILYKLVNNGTLEDVNGIISTGKESVVFHGEGSSSGEIEVEGSKRIIPKDVAIKVFKTTLTDFKNRADYMKGDRRFFKDEFKKQNTRKIMGAWADKERFNLRLMEKHGIPCPRVVLLKKHVLIMTFIGRDTVAAPKIKDANLSVPDVQLAYEQCVNNMKKMYRQCQLVHADLSAYNMLWHNNTLHFIDVGQAVERTHPHAHEFLLRDCKNVTEFFKKKGAVGVSDEYGLFNEVTGLSLHGEGHEFLMQIEEYEKNEEKMRTGMSKINYPFDFFFERATKERKDNRESQEETETVLPSGEIQLECRNDNSSSDSELEDDDWVLVNSKSKKRSLLTIEKNIQDVKMEDESDAIDLNITGDDTKDTPKDPKDSQDTPTKDLKDSQDIPKDPKD